jgi:hypothetical protein
VLFNQRFVPGLLDGSITLAFRHWRKPAAKSGGRQRIPGGVLQVDDVRVIDQASITDEDVHRAGYESRAALLEELAAWPEGDLYRIELHLAGPDEREALRQQSELSDAELTELRRKLDRYDAGKHGPWTLHTLRAIEEMPAQPAARLAHKLGRDVLLAFKTDVRRLKALGLTESLGTGYRISPRGRAYLNTIERSSAGAGAQL